MQSAANTVLKAVEKLGGLANTGGTDVFGSYDAVNDIKHQLQTARDLLSQHGPKQQPVIFDDEDDEESSSFEEADA
jgi:pyruvate/oxaloacetate carboxyltransferase